MTNTAFFNGYALLIGVGADLPITVKDATALRDVLVNPSRAAYPPHQIQLLTGTNATRQHILDALDTLIEQVNSNSNATIIVYFSGHGAEIKQQGKPTEYFLVPYGCDLSHRADTAISSLEFTAKIEAIRCQKLVVFLDCCHAGGIPALKAPDEVAVKSVPLPPDLLNILETGSGRVIVASSRENEYSYTGTPYSIFTACLSEALSGKGTAKQDGFACILDILKYLIEQVPQRTSKKQHPFVNRVDNLSDNFPLCYYAGGSKDGSGQEEYDTNCQSKYSIKNVGPIQGQVIGEQVYVTMQFGSSQEEYKPPLGSSSTKSNHSQVYHYRKDIPRESESSSFELPSKPVSANLQHLQQRFRELKRRYDAFTKQIEHLEPDLVYETDTLLHDKLKYQIEKKDAERQKIVEEMDTIENRIKYIHHESSEQ